MDEPQHVGDPRDLAAAAAHALFTQDHASQALGMRVLEVAPGYARVSMLVRADMVNGHRICHGGLIFTLADSAFAFACNSYDSVTVAAGATVEFLLPGRLGDELTAIAQERVRSRRTGLYDVEVRNPQGDCIALFRGRSQEVGGSLIDSAAPPVCAAGRTGGSG